MFEAPLITPTIGPYPNPFSVADFDGDGVEDVVVVFLNYPRSSISFLRGLSNGTFAEPVLVASDDGSWGSLGVADLNGDQRLDLVVQLYSEAADILLGNGDGSFGPPTRYVQPVGSWPATTLVADLNLDGALDVALTNHGSQVWILPGEGDGTFGAGYGVTTGTGASGASVGDFDENGIPDLVVTDFRQDHASILLGTGGGQFGAPTHLPTGFGPNRVDVADWNGDGHADLAIANGGITCVCCYVIVADSTITLYTGNGDGTFAPSPAAEVGLFPTSVRLADVDQDQYLDLVVGHDPWGGVVCFASGDRSPRAGRERRDGSEARAAASFGIDSHDPERYPGLTILRGLEDGTFEVTPWFRTLDAGRDLAVGDWNHDGRIDLLASHKDLHNLSAYLGSGSGYLTREDRLTVSESPQDLLITDLDGDGTPDLVVASWIAGIVDVLRGEGGRTFAAPVPVAVGQHPTDVAPGDFNGDGLVDLAVGMFGSADSSRSSPGDGEVVVLRGTGEGRFVVHARHETGGHVSAIRLGDMNGDGRTDLIVAHTLPASVSISLADAEGEWGSFHTYPFVPATWLPSLELADFTQDGKLDVVIPLGQVGVTVLPGTGNGSLEPVTIDAPYSIFESLVVADVNADGRLDLLAAGGGAYVLLGKGDGTFHEAPPYGTGQNPVSVQAADLDSDGAQDLVALSRYSESATVYRGTGSGSFVERTDYGTAGEPAAAVTGDLDGDGMPELAIGYRLSSSVGILWNVASPQAPRLGKAFPESGHLVVSTASGAPETRFLLEPVGSAYQNSDVDRASLSLESQGTGSVNRIFALTPAPSLETDSDRNGVMELLLRFAAADMARLFDRVQGRTSIVATVRGRLVSGGVLHATVRFTVIPAISGLHAYVSRTPSGTASTLYVATTRFGRLNVRLFDVAGRLVRELIDEPFAPAGLHVAVVGERGDQGQRLPSGVYFYRVDAAEGARTGRVTILR